MANSGFAIGGRVSALLSSRAVVPSGSATYTGSYSVEPDADGEKLKTKNMLMQDDVTVEPIPVAKTSNHTGGFTISIAEPKVG